MEDEDGSLGTSQTEGLGSREMRSGALCEWKSNANLRVRTHTHTPESSVALCYGRCRRRRSPECLLAADTEGAFAVRHTHSHG